MQRTEVIEFARQLGLGAPDRTSTANWLNYSCPFAPWRHASKRDKTASFGIKVDADKHSHYWCFGCKSKGQFEQLAFDLGQLRQKDYREIATNIRRVELVGPVWAPRKWDDVIEENWHETSKVSQIAYPDPDTEFQYRSAAGHSYLRDRGVSFAAAVALGLRYDPFQRRILFPVRDQSGRFAGFSGRRIDPPAHRDADGTPFERNGDPYLKVRDYFGLAKQRFFCGEHTIGMRFSTGGIRRRGIGRVANEKTATNAIRIIIVEGLFDYAFLWTLGYKSIIAILGSNLTPFKVEKLINWHRPVVLFMDNDKAGWECAEQCKSLLLGKIPVLEVAYPDGYDNADPASLPAGVIHTMYKEARLALAA